MQTFELNRMGLVPMTAQDMEETDGGFIWFVVAGACLLLSGCVQNNQQNGTGNMQINRQTNAQNLGDSIRNTNQGTLHVSPK
jgi:hypothetical protein